MKNSTLRLHQSKIRTSRSLGLGRVFCHSVSERCHVRGTHRSRRALVMFFDDAAIVLEQHIRALQVPFHFTVNRSRM